jgi:hypothetical protein
MRFLTLLALAGIAIAQPTFAQNAAPLRDGSHDFDFSLGSWTTELTIIKDPFNKPDEQIHARGKKVARPIWGGRGWIEEIEADGWQAANIFLYDPVAGQWSENYVDRAVGRMDSPSIGGWRDGKLEFYSQDVVGGRAMLIRGTWTIMSKDMHSYEVARSIDGGRSWHTSFNAKVTRAK